MKKQPVFFLSLSLIVFAIAGSNAQSTFSSVAQTLQANCASSGCHNAADAAGGLDVTLNETSLYNALVSQPVQNAAAAAKGHTMVEPGYVAKSFLFRKIANGFDEVAMLDSAENAFAAEHSQLSNKDLELIRQWIQYGAQQQDTVIALQTIHDFHNGSGLPLISAPPSPVDEGMEGIQLRIGPILLLPGEEVEFFHKFKTGLDREKEIYRMEAIFDNFSHHFVIFDFSPSSAATYPEGAQDAGTYAAQFPIHLGAKEVNAWNESRNDVLPPGTAYFWNDSTTVVLDYHVKNYSSTEILGATAYLNIYTRDRQPETREMKMEFPTFGFPFPFILQIPPTGQPHKEEFAYIKPGEVWEIWKTQGHTHSLGTDFDVYLRNPDGTRGAQIYEGFYNTTYTFNQGFFDTEHAPVRTTDNPFITVDMSNGIILEATWVNNSPDTVGFGLTTKDEMFAAYFSYTLKENATGIFDLNDKKSALTLYPNPTDGEVKILLNDSGEATHTIRIYSASGKAVFERIGFRGNEFVLPAGTLQPGIYFAEVDGSNMRTAKLVVH